MKKLISCVAAIGLALPVSFALPAPASAGHNIIAPLCKSIIDSGGDADFGLQFGTFHFNSIGECVSFLNTQPGSQVSICKGFLALGRFGEADLKNFGDCMVNFEFQG
jgi:hypothetical protein